MADALSPLDAGDFIGAWGGISSLQLGLSALWSGARTRGVPLERIADWLCVRTARFAGLDARKGAIAVGRDADFVVWDDGDHFVVDGAALRHRHKLTPYHGRTLHGVVSSTWLRGECVFDGAVTDRARGVQLVRV